MAKKLSDVFNSIKYAKLDPKHNKPHIGGSTDDEEHGAVSEIEFDQQVAHAKKRSMTESEAVKRTQTNLKNIEASKTGYSADDEEYRKHIERMKKSRDEYLKNTPNTIYKRNEDVEYTQEQIEEAIDHVITARQIIGHAKKNPGSSHEYMKFLKSLRDKFGKEYSTNVHQTASKLATEEVEQLDEISDELAKKVKDKRFAAASNWRSNPKAAVKSSKNFKLNQARKERLNKNRVASPEEIKYSKDNEDMRNYNKKMGYSNESVEVNEAEKMKGDDPCWKNYQMVGTKKKNGKEVPNCVPVNESRQADIVREAFSKAKNKKKDEKNDKDVSGKIQKFESDPELTDTIQKQ
jgi:hypothetical protein